jgi:hypothetical protein
MSVQITMTFNDAAAAAAFLAGRPSSPANATQPANAQKTAANADSQRTAASPSPGPAPEQTVEPSVNKSLDFHKDVIAPMKEHFKKLSREQAVAFLKGLGAEKPADLKAKPEVWQKAIDAMKA